MRLQSRLENRVVQRIIKEYRDRDDPSPTITPAVRRIQTDRRRDNRSRSARAPQVEAGQEFEVALASDNSNLRNLVESRTGLELHVLRGCIGFLDRMQTLLRADKFAYLAAAIMLKYSYAANARAEAMRILRIQLSNVAVARRMLQIYVRLQ